MTKQDIFNDVANPDQHVYNNTAGELADITNSNSSSSDTTSSIESGNSGISGSSIDYIKSGKYLLPRYTVNQLKVHLYILHLVKLVEPRLF